MIKRKLVLSQNFFQVDQKVKHTFLNFYFFNKYNIRWMDTMEYKPFQLTDFINNKNLQNVFSNITNKLTD